MISTAVDRQGNIFIRVGKVGTKCLSSDDVINIYQSHLKNAKCICSDGCPSYRKLAEKLDIELHAFKKNSNEKRGIYHINHVNYVHSVISHYFDIHHGISSKHLDEYLSLIAYKCMNKLRDTYSTLTELIRCECQARWKDYVGKANILL